MTVSLPLSDIAVTTLALTLAGAFGLLLGKLQIRKIGLGIGGVLFSGILVGHIAARLGIEFDGEVMHFVRELGLILFVYTIGIQVGPSFFASFAKSGLRFNIAAIGIVLGGVAVTLGIYAVADLPLPVLVGVMSGAVTNTPGLGAAQQVLGDAGYPGSEVAISGMGYAMAYPFGILGILASMFLIRFLFGIVVEREEAAYEAETRSGEGALPVMDVMVTNTNLDGITLGEVPDLFDQGVVASRMKTGEELVVPSRDVVLHVGDCLHLVGPKEKLHAMKLILGKEIDAPISTKGTKLTWQRLVVTKEKVLGKSLRELAILEGHGVTVSRINRAGVELPAQAGSTLAFGDIVTVVGAKEDIATVAGQLGNENARLQEVQFPALFFGIALGVLLGSIPLAVPGLPAPLKLGLAGGPLMAAIILGRIGHWGPFTWYMPPTANHALREFGIVLFLAVVGIVAGDRFFETLLDGDGLSWMGYGILITLLPLVVVGALARVFGRFNYLSLCGVLAGSMTDPPALAFAVSMSKTGAASMAYVSVYPLVMFLRILAPQVLVLLLAAGAAG
ncbi:putative transporter [Celeribacter neptunius]|uniref:Putative transport protein n=1 Tax=Celeribacter neptunius TaxID=588602 RepID=A0A1I3M3G2_9RHOB|nr:putative transporter [Celeribacter neptunius]SFI91503.1 putative transport protein [Celeribacter neptunius]